MSGTPSSGVFYAWSQLIRGGQATVSNVYTYVNEGPTMQVEFLVASGDAGYVANLTLRTGADTIVFDEVASIAATDRIPLDAPILEWRVDTPAGPATVALLPRAVSGAAAAFELCWCTRYRTLDRLSCSLHGADHAAAIEDASGGDARRIRSETGSVPWNAAPPAGTPAPPPVPHPIRYVLGSAMVQRLLAPTLDAGNRPVVLHAADGSGSTARLYATSPRTGWTFPGTIDSTVGSEVDGTRPVELSFTSPTAYRYAVAGRLDDLVLRTADGMRPLPGSHTVDPGEIYPLDSTLLEASDGVATVRALLRSIDGART